MGKRVTLTYPTQDEVRRTFDYRPETGELIWRSTGRVCGGKTSAGYSCVTISGKRYMGARIIWIWVHGSVPDGHLVDHINGVRRDDRLCNLRLATNAQNQCNRPILKKKSGLPRGVSRARGASQKFEVSIVADGRAHWLGSFDSVREAADAYDRAAVRLHGEFATLNNPKSTKIMLERGSVSTPTRSSTSTTMSPM